MKDDSKKFSFHAKKIPMGPGCYLFWDKDGEILYVGKAKHLRKRVASYFQKNKQPAKTRVLVSKVDRIETRVVNSEMEALILENNLIKELSPRFNIRLKDDKNFVYLHVTNEDWPKMEITRRLVRDGSFYLGPKTSTKEFRETVRFCQKFFRIRMVKSSLDYYPHLLSGKFEVSREEYLKNVSMMKQFLGGQTRNVLQVLQSRMMGFAEDKNFEAAAKTRDLIQSIQVSTQKQAVQIKDQVNRDFLAFEREGDLAYFVRIAFRHGQMLDQNEVVFRARDFFSDEEVVEAFLLQFYPKVDVLPREIYVGSQLDNTLEVEGFLMESFPDSGKLEIIVPQKGDKKRVLEMAEKNARQFAERKKLEEMSHAENFAKALPELAEHLGLSDPPHRIECFDISHLSGTATVASQVVFVDGEPKKSEYRRFKLKTLNGKIDDFASMREILSRRFARKEDKKFAEKFPDLIVIDGGKGQLSSVMKAVDDFSKDNLFPDDFDPNSQIIALAKREEEIFRPGQKEPLLLSFESSALKLLQRIRDEAHRFAITFNRAVRQKKAHKSVLDEISGIGGVTKKKLLKKFGSVLEIKKASDKELLEILNKKQMESLRKQL